MRFSAPHYLVLLGLVIWFWRTGAARLGARATIWRCTIVALLVLGLSGLQIRGGLAPLSVMFVIDRSGSMTGREDDSLSALRALTASMRSDDRAGIVVFGADASVERRPDTRMDLTRISSTTSGAGTNIEGALRLARTAVPAGGASRIVLLSDGQETDGRALDEAARARADGIPIDVLIPLEPADRSRPLVVTRVAAAPFARVNEPFLVTATVEGAPDSHGEIILTTGDGATQTGKVILPMDGASSVTFSAQQPRAGVYTYRAEARDPTDDFGAAPQDAGAVVAVSGEPHILYVGDSAPLLGPALTRSGFQVSAVSARSLPRSPTALAAYDSIVLDDVRADAVDPDQGSALAQYVERLGGGLLVLGSPRSLEPGLAADSPMNRMRPIDLRPRSGQRAPGLALVVVFDKSGSMDDRIDGAPKIEFARQAIHRVLESVSGGDAVGVIAFDARATAVAPLSASHDPAAIAARLRDVQPGGSTAMAPALDLASQWLRDAPVAGVSRRHVLLVSDGRTSAADAARSQAIAQQHGFELTAVALGGDGDRRFLAALAEETGGRAYFPEDVRELPALLAREAARVAGGGLVEEPFVVRSAPHALLSGIDLTAMPRLGGYVVSAARPSAETVLRSHLDDPILTAWQFGLGRVAIYTADLRSEWSAGLRGWRGFAPMFTQTMRWLGRQVEDASLYARFDETGDGVRLIVEALSPDGGYRALLDAHATIRTPSGETARLLLRESAPGQYEASVPVTAPGPYVATIAAASRNRQFEAHIVRGVYWSAEREYRSRGVNRPALASLASATGGTILAGGDSPFTQPRPPRYLDVRAWLAAAAFVLFLVDLLAPAVARAVKGRRRPDALGLEDAA